MPTIHRAHVLAVPALGFLVLAACTDSSPTATVDAPSVARLDAAPTAAAAPSAWLTITRFPSGGPLMVSIADTAADGTVQGCVAQFPADQNDFARASGGSTFFHLAGREATLTVVSGGTAYTGTGQAGITTTLSAAGDVAGTTRLRVVGTVSDETTTRHVVCQATRTRNDATPVASVRLQ